MSKLQDFLARNINAAETTSRVPVSRRFCEDGELLLFEIKGVTAAEYSEYQNLALKTDVAGKHRFDTSKFNERLVINHTLDPNFKDAKTIEAAGVKTPEQLLNQTMLAGEIDALANEILDISGYKASIEELKKEVKN